MLSTAKEDDLLQELLAQLESQKIISKRARKYRVFYYFCLIIIVGAIVFGISYVMSVPTDAQSGILLTKLALVVAICSVGIAYFQYLGLGDGLKQKNEMKIINLLTLNTTVAIANSNAHTKEEKLQLLREMNNINPK